MLFTIFTPVYNRRDKLHRVWESLKAQHDRDFEWLIVDDGSTDRPEELVRAWEREADFPVRFDVQPHAGKHAAWNRGVALARGELFVPADSDDTFVPETLARFRHWWSSIPAAERADFSGVNVLCRFADGGQIVGNPFPASPMVSQNLELTYVHRIHGEKWGCIRTDVLRETPFPSDPAFGGFQQPLSYIWFTIARRYKVLCVNEPLRIYYRDAPNSITTQRAAGGWAAQARRNVPTRYFFRNWHLNTNLDYLRRDPRELVKTAVDVWIAGLLAGRSVGEVVRQARSGLPRLLVLLTMPAGIALYLVVRYRMRQLSTA